MEARKKREREKAPERMRNDLKVAFLLDLLIEAAHIDAIASECTVNWNFGSRELQ